MMVIDESNGPYFDCHMNWNEWVYECVVEIECVRGNSGPLGFTIQIFPYIKNPVAIYLSIF